MSAASLIWRRRRAVRPAPVPVTALTVVFDERCEFCQRCRVWLAQQPLYVPVRFLAAGSPAASELGVPVVGQELVVISDDGRVWLGAYAVLMCLWATRRYRAWSLRLRGPALQRFARRFYRAVSDRRATISALLQPKTCEACDHLPGTPDAHRDPEWERAMGIPTQPRR